MFISVLLPLPDAPTRAMNSPRLDDQVKSLQGHDLEVGDLVDLDQAVAHDECAVPAMHASSISRQLSSIRRAFASRALPASHVPTRIAATTTADSATMTKQKRPPVHEQRQALGALEVRQTQARLDQERHEDAQQDPGDEREQ